MKLIISLLMICLIGFVGCTNDLPEHVWCNDMLVDVKWYCINNETHEPDEEGTIKNIRIDFATMDVENIMDGIVDDMCNNPDDGHAYVERTVEYLCKKKNDIGTPINCSYSNYNRDDYPDECKTYMQCVLNCNFRCSHYIPLYKDDPEECLCNCEYPTTKGEK